MVYPQHCSDADTVKESEAGGENEQELLTNPEEPDLNSQTENTLEVLSQEKEKELADAQAEQTGDTEQVKRDYLTAKKLDSIVEASKREEIEHAGFLLLPSESLLDEKQKVSSQSTDEPHAVTKNIIQEEAEVNSMVPEQERPCADPSMSSADMEIDEVLSSPCPGTSHVYDQLIEILHQQEEKCRRYCQQFSHIGNITETTKFERLAEECASQTEILKLASDRGYSAPNFQMEDRTFNIFRIIPELSGSEMVLTIVKGVNLPLPEGISPIDLDTSVRFMFAFPTSEEAQRDQTHSVKNSSSPEFGEQFTLHIKRNHRGFKRVILSKGIKFEIIQKGGLFKTDRVVGSAQMKLDSLETKCEIRQLIEVFRKRTPTGGYLEVQVKIREPLSGPQSETVTEKWLVLDPLSLPLVVATKPRVQENPVKQVTNRTVTCSVL
ncbi:coiled-coil and C2 domain-containing protein 1A-like isoform X2 [Hoplias malabaricus]|uniref:coiled-coil and C2 domain-containing protein 1A-like isoform X2 n=1 Tax=Hoplias malabaricus TaxID=27720 RepID=UPI003461870F